MDNIIPILVFLLFIVLMLYYVKNRYKAMTLQQLLRWNWNKDTYKRKYFFRSLFLIKIPAYILCIFLLTKSGVSFPTAIVGFGFFAFLYELLKYWQMKEIEKKHKQ